MQDITALSLSQKNEIAGYIKRDNLAAVNAGLQKAKVKDSFYTAYGKRLFDIVIALLGLLISSPVNLIIALVTFVDVGSPILFQQQRMGKDEKKFTIYKFRNMTNAVDASGELLPPEQRITKWGRLVRRTSLDELLNFVSVLKGSMSIIGPRPLPDYYAERLNDRHKAMYAVRPGLECPILYQSDGPLSWQERLDHYVWYAEHCSFGVDLKLCLRMVSVAFDRQETSRRARAEHGGVMGYTQNGEIIHTKSVPDRYVEEFCRNHGYRDLQAAIAARGDGSVLEETAAMAAE